MASVVAVQLPQCLGQSSLIDDGVRWRHRRYTHRMMSYAYDRFMPEGKTWRDLFDMVGDIRWATGSPSLLRAPVSPSGV